MPRDIIYPLVGLGLSLYPKLLNTHEDLYFLRRSAPLYLSIQDWFPLPTLRSNRDLQARINARGGRREIQLLRGYFSLLLRVVAA